MIGKFWFASYETFTINQEKEIAVFETEEERDRWVNSDLAFIPRIPLSDDDVGDIIIDRLINDPIDEGIKWFVEPGGILEKFL